MRLKKTSNMLQNHGGSFPYKMTDIYECLGLKKSNYNRWVKTNLIEGMFAENEDYYQQTKNVPLVQGGYNKVIVLRIIPL